MTSLAIATRNAHKTREMRQILGHGFEVHDLTAHPEIPAAIESGKTFKENAILKAMTAFGKLPGFVIADDSGLEVEALDGAPGIYSARYAGENARDKDNIDKLLDELERIAANDRERRARFRCVIALGREGVLLGTFEGIVEGAIVEAPRGAKGFGYDPVFLPTGFDKTFAELSNEAKNQISHRAKAAQKLTQFLSTAPSSGD